MAAVDVYNVIPEIIGKRDTAYEFLKSLIDYTDAGEARAYITELIGQARNRNIRKFLNRLISKDKRLDNKEFMEYVIKNKLSSTTFENKTQSFRYSLKVNDEEFRRFLQEVQARRIKFEKHEMKPEQLYERFKGLGLGLNISDLLIYNTLKLELKPIEFLKILIRTYSGNPDRYLPDMNLMIQESGGSVKKFLLMLVTKIQGKNFIEQAVAYKITSKDLTSRLPGFLSMLEVKEKEFRKFMQELIEKGKTKPVIETELLKTLRLEKEVKWKGFYPKLNNIILGISTRNPDLNIKETLRKAEEVYNKCLKFAQVTNAEETLKWLTDELLSKLNQYPENTKGIYRIQVGTEVITISEKGNYLGLLITALLNKSALHEITIKVFHYTAENANRIDFLGYKLGKGKTIKLEKSLMENFMTSDFMGCLINGGSIKGDFRGNLPLSIKGNYIGYGINDGKIGEGVDIDIDGNYAGCEMKGGSINTARIWGNRTGMKLKGGSINAIDIVGNETGREMTGGSINASYIKGERTGQGIKGGIINSGNVLIIKTAEGFFDILSAVLRKSCTRGDVNKLRNEISKLTLNMSSRTYFTDFINFMKPHYTQNIELTENQDINYKTYKKLLDEFYKLVIRQVNTGKLAGYKIKEKNMIGILLTELINRLDRTDFNLEPKIKIDYMGAYLNAGIKIKIQSAIKSDYFAYNMNKGEIEINGDLEGENLFMNMNGGKVTANKINIVNSKQIIRIRNYGGEIHTSELLTSGKPFKGASSEFKSGIIIKEVKKKEIITKGELEKEELEKLKKELAEQTIKNFLKNLEKLQKDKTSLEAYKSIFESGNKKHYMNLLEAYDEIAQKGLNWRRKEDKIVIISINEANSKNKVFLAGIKVRLKEIEKFINAHKNELVQGILKKIVIK